MFDEKNNVWLDIYKFIIGLTTIALFVCGIVWMFILFDDYEQGLGFLSLIGGTFLAFANQASGMLIANVIGNIQRIRECSEKLANMQSVTTSNETDELPEI